MSKQEPQHNRRTTLADVARAAGVSVMTVSNVVRGRKSLVRLDTRKRVEMAIANLNYRPNVSAQSLRVAQQSSIGIVIVDNDPAFLIDPFISRLVSGLSNYLSNIDYTLDVQGVTPERFESATILRKAGNDALCAILCGPKDRRRAYLDFLERLGQPLVVFQETLRPGSDNIATVLQDDLGAGKLLAAHLLKRPLRSVVFLRPTMDWCAVEQREKGLRAAFAAADGRIEIKTLLSTSEGFSDVQASVRQQLATLVPDAIVAATDTMGVAALKVCESEGLKIPGDIMVAGFNGFDVWQYTRPTLTTVLSPAYEMGQYAGELLVQRIRTGSFPKLKTIFPVSLQPGESAGPHP